MAEAAGGGAPRLPEDLVFSEILMRLPAKPLLRCRAVCRCWRRRITSDAKFLLAHHRRQPSLPLLTEGDRTTEEWRIDALDHRTGERRPVARTTGGTGGAEGELKVLASCDGLLILRANGCLQICNPATRQRAPLALLHGAACISALYLHRPSGSYRVLCCFQRAEDGHLMYHVHTVGSGELRCVGELPALLASRDMVIGMLALGSLYPPVLADGILYWPPIELPVGNGVGKSNNMLVFDTMAESFQHLLSPFEGGVCRELFEMSNGALGLYNTPGRGTADLWVLQDHKSWTWSLKNRIKLPALVVSVMPVLDPEGDVLVRTQRWESFECKCRHVQHISGANGSSLARYEWSGSLKLEKHRFRESLVRHDFFSMDGNAGSGVDEKPLFDGLLTVALLRDDNAEPH